MDKKTKRDKKNLFSGRDIFVILLSVTAVAVLMSVIFKSNEGARHRQEELSRMSMEMENVGTEYEQEDAGENLVINEINQAGWLELYNQGAEAINLSGYAIIVDGGTPMKIVEGTEVSPGGVCLIEVKQRLGTGDNEVVTLLDAEGEVLCKMMIPRLKDGESYGCIQDGSIKKGKLTASRGETNSVSALIQTKELEFSVPGGFYNENFQLEITAPEGCKIYYTLDSSEPDTDSMLYEKAISVMNTSGSDVVYAADSVLGSNYVPDSIHKCLVVRAIAVNTQGNIVDERTESYFIGLKNASDYSGLSVISISTDPVHLFDYFEGIYVKGRTYEDALAEGKDANEAANYLNGWKKPVYIEYFEPGKDKTFAGKMSLSVLNDFSVNTVQKSMSITGEEVTVSEGSSLAAFYNEKSCRILLQTNRRDNTYKIREYLVPELLKGRKAGVAGVEPCIVFLDGEYWGVYMLWQNYDSEFIAQNYQVDEDNVILLTEGVAANYSHTQEFAEFYTNVVNLDLSVQENYDAVKEQMDIQSFLDYFCANIYLANSNFGTEAWSVWRTAEITDEAYNDGKWRWLMPKLDSSMANETVSKLTMGSIDSFLMPGVTENEFIMSLMDSTEFREQLYQTMQDMSENVFEEKRVESILESLAAVMKKPATSSYKRFYGNPADKFFEKEIQKIADFFRSRPEYIMLYTEEVKNGKLQELAADKMTNGEVTDSEDE